MLAILYSLFTLFLWMVMLTWTMIRLPFVVTYYIYIFPPYYAYCKCLQLCDLILSVFCRKNKKIRVFFEHLIAIVQIMEGFWLKLRHAQYNEVISFMSVTMSEVNMYACACLLIVVSVMIEDMHVMIVMQ